jgi:hypothetical protein
MGSSAWGRRGDWWPRLPALLYWSAVGGEGRGLDNRGRMGIDLSRKWSSSAPPRLRVFGFFNQIWQRSDF